MSDLEFDFSRSPKVKSHGVAGLLIYDVGLVISSNICLNFILSLIEDFEICVKLKLTFQCQSRVNVMARLNFPYMISY